MTDQQKIPPEIRRWNWGAFLLNWLWGVCNSTYIALLCLVPFVNIVMVFVLGAKGNEWAWVNGHWDNVEHFKRVQRQWTIAGLIVLAIGIIMPIGLVMLTNMFFNDSVHYGVAKTAVVQSVEVRSVLGAPITVGKPQNESYSDNNGVENESYTFTVNGTKASGMAYISLEGANNNWTVQQFYVEVPKHNMRITMQESSAQ